MTTALHIIMPGLAAAHRLQGMAMPALSRMLGRGRRLPCRGAGPLRQFRRFGIDSPEPAPVAPVTRLVDAGEGDSRWWMRLDPVNLTADLHQVRLTPASELDLTGDEAGALAALFNETFKDDGWVVRACAPTRWYLTTEEPQEVLAPPPAALAGGVLPEGLPAGRHGRRWRALLSEVQLLFHDCGVNLARESRGLPPVNGLWPWGGGFLPHQSQGMRFARVYADDALSAGLASLGGVATEAVPDTAGAVLEAIENGKVVLLVLGDFDRSATAATWPETMARWEEIWLQPLERALARGRLHALELDLGDGDLCVVSRAARWRVWRTPAEPGGWVVADYS